MLRGEQMTVLEVHLECGVASAVHTHGHESMIYVVRGRVRTRVGEQVLELGAGDVGCHPAGVPHSVEALEETLFVEVKSPAPVIGNVLSTGKNG
jgi:quercetin dioxygenase-like cupin family protein